MDYDKWKKLSDGNLANLMTANENVNNQRKQGKIPLEEDKIRDEYVKTQLNFIEMQKQQKITNVPSVEFEGKEATSHATKR